MILDHKLVTAAIQGMKELTEHSPGMITSVVVLVLYALIRDGLPWYRRRRNHNPNNPGNSSLAQRILACETSINEVKESCTRTETLWEGQKEHNKRMEKHVEKMHARIDNLAGLGK